MRVLELRPILIDEDIEHHPPSETRPKPVGKNGSPRVLIIAPASPPPQFTGGMDVALSRLASELEQRGWIVEIPLGLVETKSNETSRLEEPSAIHVRISINPPPLLNFLRGSRLRSLIRLPRSLRGYLGMLVGRPTIRKFNENLSALETILESRTPPDAVILFSGYATPGMCALALTMRPSTVLVSTSEPALELRLGWAWSMMRRFWSWRLKGHVHPFLYRPSTANQMKCVVFISGGWRDEALRQGLNEANAQTIYFGVPNLPSRASRQPRGRLLCIGRMNRDKGLHRFVEAMPAIMAVVPDATLTMIARPEDDAYQASIYKTVHKLRLAHSVTILPRVTAVELQRAYQDHDVLLCISPFSEPVPLVMMEAFMTGLPVIISKPRTASPLVQSGHTCLCFNPKKIATLIEAIRLMHEDSALRAQLTANARALVTGPFSLQHMGAQYDALLRMRATNAATG